MKNKYLAFSLLALFLFGIPSCTKEEECECCNLEPVNVDAEITGFEIDKVEKRTPELEFVPYINTDTVDAFGILFHLKPEIEELVFHQHKINIGLFSNTAYACNPPVIPVVDQEFVGLKITSNEDYNVFHPSGTDLIDLFSTRGNLDNWSGGMSSFSYHLYLEPDYFLMNGSVISLSENPSMPSSHIFTFELQLSDTTIYFESPEVHLM